jgi:hypothetical protein
MSVNIVSGFENLFLIMKECVEREMTPTGLLSDVETFIPVYLDEESAEEPIVWMYQLETVPSRQADISGTMELITPFQFNCAVYEAEIEDANTATQNLANRVGLSILKNWQTIQSTKLPGQRMISSITFETYYPLGTIQVNGKSERLPVTGLVLNIKHKVNWTMCCRNLTNNQGD